jgi:hypothetical protein
LVERDWRLARDRDFSRRGVLSKQTGRLRRGRERLSSSVRLKQRAPSAPRGRSSITKRCGSPGRRVLGDFFIEQKDQRRRTACIRSPRRTTNVLVARH